MLEQFSEVKMWEEDVYIDTYPVGTADKNPMFLEKRVYQGSSGRVYPYPVIDKIYDNKISKRYKAIYLENDYLKIMVLPELGGRIQRATDKTNNYDFVYYNHVIKPALVGLAGPWISGGIEFNWPQHHRPNTFGPVEHLLEEGKDGSKTVWVSEIDRMYGSKGMAGFTLYPSKAYLEIKGQLYNRTPQTQTFLWWANPAVPVNDNTQSIFPPDVHAVMDHGKRDVSNFPIATGTYYKMDYSAGVDISRYKNIPVPTSYMAYHSDYNFVGGYDYGVKAGILHVADHHISPGKKQWTWGSGDFGKAWDRNLTDDDGPYIELMTGVFTDNQPDFAWLQPYEEKTFKQYFMPYKNVGVIKNANINCAVGLDIIDTKAIIGVYATTIYKNANITLSGKEKKYINCKSQLSPKETFTLEVELEPGELESNLLLCVYAEDGKELVSYRPKKEKHEELPEPARAIVAPEELKTNEALYLAGIHLEQYRHATYQPDSYYLEGLKRDKDDIRINNAYGSLLFRRGQFESSIEYFKRAIKTNAKYNTNPSSGEPHYNLGLSLKYTGNLNDAYDAFYKSIWSAAWQATGYYSLAQIDCIRKDYDRALEHIDISIIKNYHNCAARNLKAAILRKRENYKSAEITSSETIEIDKLDFGARNELYLIALDLNDKKKKDRLFNELRKLMRDDPHNYIALAVDYSSSGLFYEAIDILSRFLSFEEKKNSIYPMIYYYLGYYYSKINAMEQARACYILGAGANCTYCFPNTLHDILVLKSVQDNNPKDSKAYYYLGNLWYDKRQYVEAINCFEKSADIGDSFPTVHRNLALAYFNKMNNPQKAKQSLEKAFELNTADARVYLELDQLYKKLNISNKERLESFKKNIKLVNFRDDLYIEYVTLLNLSEDYDTASDLISKRKFHPWEGGEGKVTKQYVYAHVEISKKHIKNRQFKEAIVELESAQIYPENLGEGKLKGTQENDINYYMGIAFEGLGEREKSKQHYLKASVGLDEPSSAMFYNDQPPEMIFYQGLALLKVDKLMQAKQRFNKLIDYGKDHLEDNITIDYFAVSLSDFLIFDEDLNKKNKINCHYLMALGYFGLKNSEMSKSEFSEVIKLDANHQGSLINLEMTDF